MPTYSANQGDDEDEGAGEVTQDDDEDEVGEGAGEVTRPRGIAWWQLNLYVPPPSCCCPAPPLIIHPGTKSPSCAAPLPPPSFFHPLPLHRSPLGKSLIRDGGGGGGGGEG